jgi:hypothetical protein
MNGTCRAIRGIDTQLLRIDPFGCYRKNESDTRPVTFAKHVFLILAPEVARAEQLPALFFLATEVLEALFIDAFAETDAFLVAEDAYATLVSAPTAQSEKTATNTSRAIFCIMKPVPKKNPNSRGWFDNFKLPPTPQLG